MDSVEPKRTFVLSSSGSGTYVVSLHCECRGFRYKGACRHLAEAVAQTNGTRAQRDELDGEGETY